MFSFVAEEDEQNKIRITRAGELQWSIIVQGTAVDQQTDQQPHYCFVALQNEK